MSHRLGLRGHSPRGEEYAGISTMNTTERLSNTEERLNMSAGDAVRTHSSSHEGSGTSGQGCFFPTPSVCPQSLGPGSPATAGALGSSPEGGSGDTGTIDCMFSSRKFTLVLLCVYVTLKIVLPRSFLYLELFKYPSRMSDYGTLRREIIQSPTWQAPLPSDIPNCSNSWLCSWESGLILRVSICKWA